MFNPDSYSPLADFFGYESYSSVVNNGTFTLKHSTSLPPFMYPDQSATSTCTVINPLSRGSTHISSLDPNAQPKIISGLYSSPLDLNYAFACFGLARTLVTTSPFSSGIAAELLPGSLLAPDGDFTAIGGYVVGQTQPGWATSSTCSIGTVLTPELLVQGIENLRVADNSAYPSPITLGSPSATAFILGLGAGLFATFSDYTVNIDLTRGNAISLFAHGYQLVTTPSQGNSNVCADIGANPVVVSEGSCVEDDISAIIGGSTDFWIAPRAGDCMTFDFVSHSCTDLKPVLCRSKGQQV